MSRTFIQVFSRVAVVWGAMDPLYKYPFTPFPKPKGCELTLETGPECTEERNHQVVAMTLITWSIAELIRYSFYGLNTIDPKMVPFPIVCACGMPSLFLACSSKSDFFLLIFYFFLFYFFIFFYCFY